MRRRRGRVLACGVAGAGAVACAVAVTVPAATGCYTHQCDASAYDYSGGFMPDSTTWESNEIDQPWLNYGPNATVRIHFPPSIGRAPTDVHVYVGTGTEPNGPGYNYSEASGQLAIVNFLSPSGMWVTNGSCADYYAWVVVHFLPPSLVLFGGTTGTGAAAGAAALGDTFSWDGRGWTTSTPPNSPPLRSAAIVATLGDHLVMFGGIGPVNGGAALPLGDTWTWDGQTWSQLFPPHGPPPRYDAASGVVVTGGSPQLVMFGGRGFGDGGIADLDDTWTWDGNDWIEQHPGTSPPARSGAAAGGVGDALVVFGGTSAGGAAPLGDTWVWRHGDWTQAGAGAGASFPSPRTHAAATSFGGQVVLFGGAGAQGALADTWLWNGSGWGEATPSGLVPPARSSAAMGVFDGAALLFGGVGTSGKPLGDTWTWNGSTWTEQNVQGSPPPRAAAAIAAN